jgi:hypothetical protein
VATLWRELVEDARWAPSPHNTQPWLLRIQSEREAELLYVPGRLLPGTDPGGRFVTVGLGLFVEALAIAAAARGQALEALLDERPLDPAAPGPVHVAGLRLGQLAGEEPLASRLLLERRTSRIPYDGRSVPDAVLDELTETAADAGHVFSFSSDPELVRSVVALNEDTLFYDMADRTARLEVGGWLRFSASEASRRRDGFSPAALGFPGLLLRLFFRAHWLLELPGPRGLVHRFFRRTMHGSQTIGWLSGPFEQPSDWFQAGRMLLRVWLTMTSHGVQLHPFGSVITNRRANACLHELIRSDPTAGTLWLVVRLGYSNVPPRSHRLETDEILIG